jgi:hypothetical protein
MDCANFRLFVLFLMTVCLQAALGPKYAPGAWREDFEGPQATWQPGEADLDYRTERHQRIEEDDHSGKRSELIQISGSMGSYAYFTQDVPAGRVVAELTPSVWIKANRPGIQLLARVVLPQSIDPRTGRPVATLVHGSSYTSVGAWQQLRITDIPQLLSRQVRVLRAQIGPDVDAREAYVDQVLLNVYGGPGQSAVVIDDLEIVGLVPRQGVVQPVSAIGAVNDQPAGSAGAPSGSASTGITPAGNGTAQHQVTIDGSLLLVDGRPMLPRVIQSQGEPLAWLKEQGFNVVRTTAPLTPEMLAEAQRVGIWLIGPPPLSGGQAPGGGAQLGEITPAFEPVLAWHLGSGLANRELPATIALAKQLRASDRQLRRPLMCGVEEQTLSYSRQVDILTSSRFPLDTSLELKDYAAWLRERPRLARPGTPLWTEVQTEVAPELTAQCLALAGKQAPEPAIDADALRLLTYQAFASGMRGIEFASDARLDANDNATHLRALTLALLNLELDLMEPWGAAGNFVASASSTDPNIRGVVLSTDTARLVLAIRCPKRSQYMAAPQDVGASIIVPGVPDAHEVYELTPAGLRKLQHKRVAGGVSITLDDFLLTSAVLITADPVVVNSRTNRAKELAPRAAQLQRDLAAAMLAEVETVDRRLGRQPQLPPAAAKIAEARGALQRADELLATGDFPRAYQAARNAVMPLGHWKHETWDRMFAPTSTPATTPLAVNSPASSPLVVSFDTLPEHLSFMSTVGISPPGENLLAGGDFEDLQAMLQAGWQHFEHSQPDVQTNVELSPIAPYAGHFSLRLQAQPPKPDTTPTLVETTPLWITSAPIHVEAGDVVCIRGQVRVQTPISGSIDGLMIIDSLGGEPLAERIGETSGWKEFVLYRAAPSAKNMTLTFALTGLGEACIDDVSIRMLRRGGAAATPNLTAVGGPPYTLPPGSIAGTPVAARVWPSWNPSGVPVPAPTAAPPVFGAPPLR